MTHDAMKNRIKKALSVIVCAGLILAAYATVVSFTGIGIPCPFKTFYRIDCAGCGMSRAASALLRFDFRAAFSYNLIWPVFLIYGIWLTASSAISYVKDGSYPTLPRPKWLNWVFFAVMLAYGIIRNFI